MLRVEIGLGEFSDGHARARAAEFAQDHVHAAAIRQARVDQRVLVAHPLACELEDVVDRRQEGLVVLEFGVGLDHPPVLFHINVVGRIYHDLGHFRVAQKRQQRRQKVLDGGFKYVGSAHLTPIRPARARGSSN